MILMREIGSEFWDLPITCQNNKLFPESTQWYLSGRSGLQAIISELGELGTVSLPSWCCDSMIKPFIDAGMEVIFYPVYWQKSLIQEINLDTDVLFLMDYFGYSTIVPDLSGYNGVVIRDVTHSLLSSTNYDADYYFGSLRKWCGVWTGGFAWTMDGHRLETGSENGHEYVAFRKKAMDEKKEYIKGVRADKDYLKVFDEAEELLETVGIARAAERDEELAQKLDLETIKNRRRVNAEVLRHAFPKWLIFPTLAPTSTPMFVPILVPDGKRDALRRYLINHEIYCPIHWPVSEYHKLDERTAYIYQNELSLVCDQRYTEQDMQRMIDTIKQFMEA